VVIALYSVNLIPKILLTLVAERLTIFAKE
jgi:hypothetical protein